MKKGIKDNQPVIITSIIAGAVLLTALIIISSLSYGSANKITVEGVASIDAVPDLMSVYFMIETQGETSAEAKDANNEILNSLVTEILGLGFERSELQTQSFNIYPNYEWDDGERSQDGYRATHLLKLELSSDEFDKISDVIDAGVDAGAGINYINFELSQELQNQYKAEALELASEDAQIKADAVASGFGKRAGRLVSVQVSDFGYYPWNVFTAREETDGYANEENAAVAKQAVASIEPGEQEITARVSATFRII